MMQDVFHIWETLLYPQVFITPRVIKPAKKVVKQVCPSHLPINGDTSLPSVVLLHLSELDSEFLLYTPNLLGVTNFNHLLLFKKVFDVTCYPGFVVSKERTDLT